MRLNKYIFFSLLCFIGFTAFGQLEEPHKTEKSYYTFPIKPGQRNYLAGTMGELRSNHFHTGIDIRTEGRTGLAVHASAQGYVSRVAISSTGYGNALYITHPNGYITVYAHLERFVGPLADYIRQEQYRRKQSEMNLYFHKDRFPIKKGELVAYSGNSGSSGGPHLHYDIRDKNNNPVNPLEFGFNEILDHTPPIAQKLVIKTLDKYARVNDQFGRAIYNTVRVGNNYVINEPIAVYGTIGMELYAYDKLDNSRFRCGINTMKVEVDNEVIFTQNIDKLSFAKQRDILVHMDYTELQENGLRYHKLYVDDGNDLDFYQSHEAKLRIEKPGTHQVHVTMTDSYGNTSYVDFSLIYKTPEHDISDVNINQKNHQLIDNTLVITAPAKTSDNTLDMYLPKLQKTPAAYIVNNKAVYLWDMHDGLPYSYKTDENEEILNYQTSIPSGTNYNFYSQYVDIDFTIGSLFDTLYMNTHYTFDSTNNREIFNIGNELVPLRKYVSVDLKPVKDYKNNEKFAVYGLSDNGGLFYKGGKWEDGKIMFYTRDFGKYTIAADTIPPKIIPIKTNASDLVFKITDERSGIKDFKCLVNGEWVLMHYDYKRALIWSEKLNNDVPFEGEVKLTLQDNANNKTEYIVNL